jgi:hypothetical protein
MMISREDEEIDVEGEGLAGAGALRDVVLSEPSEPFFGRVEELCWQFPTEDETWPWPTSPCMRLRVNSWTCWREANASDTVMGCC